MAVTLDHDAHFTRPQNYEHIKPTYAYCGKCGRPLTSERSQRYGFGSCCRYSVYDVAKAKIIIVLVKDNK